MNVIFYIILIVYCSVAVAGGSVESTDDKNLIIELPYGKLRGKDNGFYYSYESIPYAEPPIGKLRFEPPKVYTKKWSTVFDATKEPVKCMQWDQYKVGENKLTGVEDCLTVNIYKPKTNTTVSSTNPRLPVVILIHGGAFMFGSLAANNHERVMRNSQTIVVKMTYRLGPLGFLSTEDTQIPGNNGLKDQLLAIKWIKQNIASFGGDPEQMLAIGFSAGGSSVHLHMLDKNFSKYVHAAASLSGTALNPWVIIRNARKRAFEMGTYLNCNNILSSVELKECLQEKSAEDIVTAVKHFLIFGYNPFTTFGPVIEHSNTEDAFLIKSPEEIIKLEDFAQIPWLVSYTAQDGGYNAAELLQKDNNGTELISILNSRWLELAPYALFFNGTVKNNDDHALALKANYLGDKEFSVETYPKLQQMYTDILFKNGVEESVRLHKTHGNSAVYAYIYDNPADKGIGTSLANRMDINIGTVHGDDFFLIFHNPARNSDLRVDEQINSNKFIKMLEQFAYNSEKLSYGDCEFINNTGKDGFDLLFIQKNSCKNMELTAFP